MPKNNLSYSTTVKGLKTKLSNYLNVKKVLNTYMYNSAIVLL